MMIIVRELTMPSCQFFHLYYSHLKTKRKNKENVYIEKRFSAKNLFQKEQSKFVSLGIYYVVVEMT